MAYALVVLFALPFALIGLVSAFGLIQLGYHDIAVRFWKEVPCTILDARLIEEPGDEAVLYHVEARYSYHFGGVEKTGKRVSFHNSTDNIGTYHKTIFAELDAHQKSGQPFRCYVNPSQPEDSVLYREGRWVVSAMQTWFSILFSGIGFGMLAATFGSFNDKRSRSTRSTGPQPWNRRADWASGEISFSDRKTSRILLNSGLAVMAFGLVGSLPCWIELMQGNAVALIGLIPAIIGLLIFRSGLSRRFRWARYGDSVFKMASVPGVVGGSIAGVVQTDRPVESDEGFRVHLYCTEKSSSSSDDEVSSSVVWEAEQIIVRVVELSNFAGTAIPVMIAIPYDAPQTEENPDRDQKIWTLDVKSLSQGVNYHSQFVVPVFRTPDSKRDYQPPKEGILPYEAPPDSNAPLRQAGLYSEVLQDGSVQFVFPRGRTLIFAVAIALMQTIFAVGIVAFFYFQWPAAWPYAAAVLGYGLLSSIVDLFLFRSEVGVSERGLSIKTGCFWLGSAKEIDAADIENFGVASAGSVNSTHAMDLFVKLNNGRRVILGKRIMPARVADEIIRRMNERLKRR